MAKLNINKPKVLTAVAGFVLAAMHITLFLGVADGMMNLVNTVKFLAALVMAGAALNVAFSVKDSNRPMFIAAAASSVMFGISYLASAAAFYNTYLRLWSETALSLGIVELIVDFCMFLALVLIGICMILDFGLASKADGILLIILSLPYLVELTGAWSVVFNTNVTGIWAWFCNLMEGLVSLKASNLEVTCCIETCLYVIGVVSIPRER